MPSAEPAAELARELELLRALLGADDDALARAAAAGETTFERLAGTVVRHQIAVPLLRRLDAADATAALPAPFVARLRRRDELQRRRTASLLALHGRLHAELERRRLPYLLLKGPILARRLYGGLDDREFADLDLLIRPRDAPAVRQTLADLGLRRRSRTLVGAALTTRIVHALDFVAPEGAVDLHWAIDRHPSLRLDPERIWRGAERQRLGDVEVAVAAEADEILAACLGVVRDGERGRLKLKSLLDLHRWLAKPEPWPELLRSAREQRASTPALRALELAVAAFGAPAGIAPELAGALREGVSPRPVAAVLPALLRGTPGATARRWAFRAWQASPLLNAAWWLASLPFRIAAHGYRRGQAAGAGAAIR